MIQLTASHRIRVQGYYWRVAALRTWPAQDSQVVASFRSAIDEAREPIELCLEVKTPADPAIALPASVSYECAPLVGYVYPERQRSSVPTESIAVEEGSLVAIVLDGGVVHQWRLSRLVSPPS